MTAAQIHLALNHFPIAGIILALPILLWGFFTKKEQIKIVGITIVLAGALSAIVVMQTGEGTEEIVEHKPGVTKELIHEHEEAAEAAMVAIQLTAILGIAWLGLNKFNKKHIEKIFILMLVSNVAAAGLIADAAHKGGQIRHDEIRDKNSQAISKSIEKGDESHEEEKGEKE